MGFNHYQVSILLETLFILICLNCISEFVALSAFETLFDIQNEPPAGLEPAIPGLGGRCRIHWATGASYKNWKTSSYLSLSKGLSVWRSNNELCTTSSLSKQRILWVQRCPAEFLRMNKQTSYQFQNWYKDIYKKTCILFILDINVWQIYVDPVEQICVDLLCVMSIQCVKFIILFISEKAISCRFTETFALIISHF